MTAKIHEFSVIKGSKPVEVNKDSIDLVEELLERLKNGKSSSVAIVEVSSDGNNVSTAFTVSNFYHQLASGCATLLKRVTDV